MSELGERLADIRARIAAAARESGRRPEDITLVAVSKLQPIELLREAMTLGLDLFGENYAQELRDKAAVLPGARWHFIGRFQKNKINMIKDMVTCWETLASADEADALATRVGRPTAVMLQVNIGREAQKAGADPDAVPELARAIAERAPLRLDGLMCIPPEGKSVESFAAMAALRRRVEQTLGRPIALSMGMSDDFEVAIRHGATHVRIGSRLFGARRVS